jgi:hypothetical protein
VQTTADSQSKFDVKVALTIVKKIAIVGRPRLLASSSKPRNSFQLHRAFVLCPLIFEAFGNNGTKRAGALALLETTKTLPEETRSCFGEGDDDRSPQHAQQVLFGKKKNENGFC